MTCFTVLAIVVYVAFTGFILNEVRDLFGEENDR